MVLFLLVFYTLLLSVTPAGRLLFSGDSGNNVRAFNTNDNSGLGVISTQSNGVQGLLLSPDESTLFTGNDAGEIKAISIPSYSVSWTANTGGRVIAFALSEDGAKLFSGSNTGDLKAWNRATGASITTLDTGSEPYLSCAVSGTYLVASTRFNLFLFNTTTYAQIRYITSPDSGYIYTVAIYEGFIYTGEQLFNVRVWNLQTGELVQTLTGHTAIVFSVIISTDGLSIFSGDEAGEIKVWDRHTFEYRRTLSGIGAINSLAALNTTVLYACSATGNIVSFNPNTGSLTAVLANISGISFARLALIPAPDDPTTTATPTTTIPSTTVTTDPSATAATPSTTATTPSTTATTPSTTATTTTATAVPSTVPSTTVTTDPNAIETTPSTTATTTTEKSAAEPHTATVALALSWVLFLAICSVAR